MTPTQIKPLLGLRIPTSYLKTFTSLSSMHLFDEQFSQDSPFLYSTTLGTILRSIPFSFTTLLKVTKPIPTLSFEATKKDYDKLKSLFPIIAIPHNCHLFRSSSKFAYLSPEEHQTNIYLGFKSLDELRTRPPLALITSIPFTSASEGIDLSQRERRPMHLPPFTPTLKLTKPQIKLAKENISHIKEALEWSMTK